MTMFRGVVQAVSLSAAASLALSCAGQPAALVTVETADGGAPTPTYPPIVAAPVDACDAPAVGRRLFSENRGGVRDPILFANHASWVGPPCLGGSEPVLHRRVRGPRDGDGMLCGYQRDEVSFGGRVPVDLGDDVIFSDGSTLASPEPAIVDGRPLRAVAGSTAGRARLLLDDSGRTWCFPGDGEPAIAISDVPVGRDAVHFGRTLAPVGAGRWRVATCDRDGVTRSPVETVLGAPLAVAEDGLHMIADRGAGPELFVEGQTAPLPLPSGYVPRRFVGAAVVALRPDGGETVVSANWPRTDGTLVHAPLGVHVTDEVIVDSFGNSAITFQNTGACPFLAE